MAGSYADPPNYRIPVDVDGTVLYTKQGGSFGVGSGVPSSFDELAASLYPHWNDEDFSNSILHFQSGSGSAWEWVGALFPRLMDLTHLKFKASYTSQVGDLIQISSDTTNLVDGNWTNALNAEFGNGTTSKTLLRSGFLALTMNNVRGIRIRLNQDPVSNHLTFYGMHFYGTLSAGQDTDYLEFVQVGSTARTPANHFEWSDVQQSTTRDKTFRVINRSASARADDILISVEALTNTSPTVVDQFTFSMDGSPFTSTLTIPSLDPGEVSSVITVRQTIPSNAVLGLWWPRLRAVPAYFGA